MKDPDDRWQSARDLRDELLWIASGSAETAAAAVPGSRRRERFAWMAAAILAAVSAYAFLRPHVPAEAPGRVIRFPLPLPEDTAFAAISPDGEKVLFRGPPAGTRQIGIYDLASGESRPLAGVDNFGLAFWSPDSRAIGFSGLNQSRKIDLASGLVSVIHDGVLAGGAWSPDGSLLFSKLGEGVSRIPAGGGDPVALTKLVTPDAAHFGIVPLGDGRRFLFFAGGGGIGGGLGEIRIGSIDGKPPVVLMKSDSVATYAQPGYLLYLKGDTLVAQPFDASRAAITGPARPLINRVGRSRFNTALPHFSASQNGVLIYRPGTRFAQSRLTWFDRSGTATGTVGDLTDYSNPALSPDGRSLSFNYQTKGGYNLWLLGMSGADHKPTVFHSTPFREVESGFSPDGKFLTYTSYESGHGEIFAQSLAPGGGRWQISTHGGVESRWRPDGKEIFYIAENMLTAVDIKVSGNALVPGFPHGLFKISAPFTGRNRYVVTRDGKRFLVIVPQKEGPPPPYMVVVNWPALLPKK